MSKRGSKRSETHSEKGAGRPMPRRLVSWAFAFSGAAALIYEVVWTRELALVFGSTVYAVSLMLAAFMTGLAVGGYAGGRLADRATSSVRLFALLELGVGVFGVLSIPIIRALPTVYFLLYRGVGASFGMFLAVQFATAFLVMALPTVFMGASFPVVSRIATTSMQTVGHDVGTVYSVNTLGSVLGSTIAGFLLIPAVGVQWTTVVAACVNLGVGLLMLSVDPRPGKRAATTLAVVTIAGLTFAIALGVEEPVVALNVRMSSTSDFVDLATFKRYVVDTKVEFLEDTAQGRVAVLRTPDGALQLRTSGLVEGAGQFLDAQTTELLAHLAIQCAPAAADDVLVIGLGTGSTAATALGYPITRLDVVEINPAVERASKLFVGSTLADDARCRTVIADARQYLTYTDMKYDVIISEPSQPVAQQTSSLFTTDFLRFVRAHLTEQGTYCQWLPVALTTERDRLMIIKSVLSVFPNSHVWLTRSPSGEAIDMVIVAINGDQPVDPAGVANRVSDATGGEFRFELLAEPATASALVADPTLPLNTDDRPFLEFSAPRLHVRNLTGP